LLGNVCTRLTGKPGAVAAIFRLDTSFGGGKTHGLIALVHAARGMTGVANPNEFIDPPLNPRNDETTNKHTKPPTKHTTTTHTTTHN